MGDTVWSQFLGAHEITDRDTVSYLRQGQHLCPEHTAGWKLSGPIWRARWGECRPCRPHGGWMTVLCDSSLQFYWHRQTYIHTFTYDELTCICWLGRRSTNRIIHMPQSHYMVGKWVDAIICLHRQWSSWPTTFDGCHQLLLSSKEQGIQRIQL